MKFRSTFRGGYIPYLLLFAAFALRPASAAAERSIIALNGKWDIAEGSADAIPTDYYHTIQVPGLADMAVPRFSEVGQKSGLREAFWYRRTFKIDGDVPGTALLKFHKAKFGIKVFVNGQFAGQSNSCFTPNYFDVRDLLRGNGATNVLTVRVGAFHDVLPPKWPYGHDFEKIKYIPGIYDDVELIVTGTPHVTSLQVAPDVRSESARVSAVVKNGSRGEVAINLKTVIKGAGGEIAAEHASGEAVIAAGGERTFDFTVPIRNCRLWSPENPFLYEITLDTGGDVFTERFGMRSFRFDPRTGRALLNENMYYMRGTNVCIFRFFEDPARGGKPWDEAWVRKLHRTFKEMNWNSIRYCIGFPPEMWYRIADEEGILIQDEYPLWGEPQTLDKDILVKEYTAYMESHWNHPCVVIWDAQNETITNVTGEAIQAVRGLDLSNRPWDNGWSEPQEETDGVETHPYLFGRWGRKTPPGGPLHAILSEIRIPHNGPTERSLSKRNFDDHPIIINEYGWIWLNRDGSPTTLTENIYRNLGLQDVPASERLEWYAYYLAALTEYWRCHRKCAGVLHFCGLGYSRSEEPRGQTSDHFIDLENLTLEPHFEDYVKDAFEPLGIMIDMWRDSLAPGEAFEAPVYVINDFPDARKVTVDLLVVKNGRDTLLDSRTAEVGGNGREILVFACNAPAEEGGFILKAVLTDQSGEKVESFRKITAAQ